MVSCMAPVKLATVIDTDCSSGKVHGAGNSPSVVARSCWNSSQLTVRKLQVGVAGADLTGNSRMVSMGTWSVPGPLCRGSVEQLTISDSECSVQKTLSSQVQFFMAMASRVGMSLGSAITIP